MNSETPLSPNELPAADPMASEPTSAEPESPNRESPNRESPNRESPNPAPAAEGAHCSGTPLSPGTSWHWWVRLVVQPLLFCTFIVLFVIGLGLVQRLGWMSADGGGTEGAGQDAGETQYICPMMCTPPQNEPGRCPVCGMELVPSTNQGGGGDSDGIVVDSVARRIAGIETAEVESAALVRQLRAVGKLTYNQGGLKTLAAYVDGRIERLFADYTGVEVNEGDRLAVVYSPELYSAQIEYLSARKNDVSRRGRVTSELNGRLRESARERLVELGMRPSQIDQLEATGEARKRLDLHAEITGTVIEKLATEGDYVTTGQPIYRLADLTSVWLMLELFPEDAAHIRYGQQVEAEVQSLAGETFLGRVAFVDRSVDPQTRTVGVRVVIPNPEERLRVGDFATAHIEIPIDRSGASAEQVFDPELAGKWISPRHPHFVSHEPGHCEVCGIEMVAADDLGFQPHPVDRGEALRVPRRSVLHAGKTSLVYVETEPGRFEPRRVTLGPNIGDSVVVMKGLQAGERVAVAGNFLIDSQMQLAGNPSLIDPSRIDGDHLPHQHEFTPEQLAQLKELDESDQALAQQQRICPVTQMPLGSMGQPKVVEVDRRRTLICCEGCRQPLLDAPEEHIALLDEQQAELEDEAPAKESDNGDLPPIAAPSPISPGEVGRAANEEGAR